MNETSRCRSSVRLRFTLVGLICDGSPSTFAGRRVLRAPSHPEEAYLFSLLPPPEKSASSFEILENQVEKQGRRQQ
ncbi:MAG: hypothetical protein JWP89_3656 [Schlesneria sp.]|nr:hypothetical protein [Schlesneria sp.]